MPLQNCSHSTSVLGWGEYPRLLLTCWGFSSKYQDSTSGRGFQSSVHDRYRSNNAQAYDKSLLQKLDSRRGSDNKTPPRNNTKSMFSSSASDASPTARMTSEQRYPTQLKPLSLPILTNHGGLSESPIGRWTDSTPLSGISPGNTFHKYVVSSKFGYRSPTDAMDYEKSPLAYSRRSGSGSGMSMTDDASSVTSKGREDYEMRVSPDNDVDFQMEETGLRRLYIEDYPNRPEAYSPGVAAGQKRRASSPLGEMDPALHTVGSASDLFRRRESAAARASPAPHLHSASASISSNSSAPRTNSHTSTMSLSTGSITSLGSYGRLSPGGISPGGVSPGMEMPDSPYVTSLSLNSSPRGSISRQEHQRTLSESRPLVTGRKPLDNTGSAKHPSLPRSQGGFMCECCPKKPKKFDSQEDLK